MKKFILSVILLLCILHSKAQLFHEDFEVADSVISSGNPGWTSNNSVSVGGSFCYTSGIQNAGDTTILSTLFFDCSSASKVFLSFDHICKSEFSDMGVIEVSTDSGATFIQLDNSNSYYVPNSSSWTGGFASSSYSAWLPPVYPDNTWWKKEVFNVSSLLANMPSVVIRFRLYDGNNNGGVGNAGWFIDNLSVESFAVEDAGVTEISNPGVSVVANASVPVDIMVKNYGADTLFSFSTGYTINGGSFTTQPWTGVLSPGDTVSIGLPAFTAPNGTFTVCAFTSIAGDANQSNDSLCMGSNGIPILTLPYSDDFEGTNAGWLEPNLPGTPTLWELGTPNYGLTNTANSGTRCWDTNLDTSYIGPANAILYSPYFDFTGVGNASLSFWQNRNTEPGEDGLRLEFNTGGGWITLGKANNPLNTTWYTDSLLNSTQQPAWEGNSNGWVQCTYPLPSLLAGLPNVQFRFVFSCDGVVNSDGVSIDDFSIDLSSCGSTINFSTNPGLCGDSYSFNYTSSAPVLSQFWDLGNGALSSQATANSFYTSGSYLINLYIVDSNGCASSSIQTITVNSGFSVNTGPDVFSCLAPAQLNAVPSQPGTYLYNWSPIAGLNNPFIQNPQASHVDSITYTVTVTDLSNGCTATDQIIVSAYSAYNDTITICLGGATFLDLGPGGGNTYLWQNFTDTLGNITAVNTGGQTLLVSQPGTYTATATFPLCGVINSIFTIGIDTSCITDVWPGDCNYDQTASNDDLLNIGLSYNTSGPVRPAANINWIAQPAPDWQNYFTAGINFKHSDCDGNGTIDSADVQAILQNYGLVHPLKPADEQSIQSITPSIYLTADVDTAGLSDVINITVNLGTASVPVDSIYGIAFSITYEQFLVDTNSATTDFSASWIGIPGSNAITLEKHFSSQGFSDLAITRRNQSNIFNGDGPIAVMTIVTTDNLSGKTLMNLKLMDIRAITYSEYVIPLTGIGDSVIIDPNFTAVEDIDVVNDIMTFPNPAQNDLFIRSKNTRINSIELKNSLGQSIRKQTVNGASTHLNTSGLSNGIFFLSVLTDKGVISKKVQVIK